ncbi:hypothetical protein GUJ93_ZPchr0013g37529 [Zizania palustris]|uniref:Uncharacterized protein n=1 Tax=Zizania palustris TaxID=103762 RepID=A0A8J6BWI5_ZIZPA|nr:hypothetical protein GUJ93_ZPchr0013g37529 [Zizania palustris]
MMMVSGLLLSSPSPPPLPLPRISAASCLAVARHEGGRRHRRRPLEPRCRSPEMASSGGGSGGRVSYDEGASAAAADVRPLDLDAAAASSDDWQGSTGSTYQVISTAGETSDGDSEDKILLGASPGQDITDGISRSKSRTRYFKAFGVDLSPDNAAVAIVYFVQGVLGLSRLATAVISGLSALPWLVKPLYGFISDSIPLFGYRRRSYLILSGLLGALSWSLMATIVDGKYSAAISITLGSLAVAISDVVVDSMVVERARGEPQSTSGSLQSLCWGSSAFGGIMSAYFSGSLVDTYGVRFVFGVTAFLPLMTSAVAALVNEHR